MHQVYPFNSFIHWMSVATAYFLRVCFLFEGDDYSCNSHQCVQVDFMLSLLNYCRILLRQH